MEHFSDYTEDLRHVLQAGCDDNVWRSFHKGMEEKLWRVDALLLASAIMVGVIVGIDAYSQRYRHHPFTRFIYLGATTLFLPIISSVVSSINTGFDYSMIIPDIWDQKAPSLMAVCNPDKHSVLVQFFAFGRNPCLVSRYMRQLQPMAVPPLPLLVMGEESRHIEKHPRGYVLMYDDDNSGSRTMSSSSLHKPGINGLVTVDRVWQQPDGNNGTMLLPA
ncbi:unnamed protein product [Miscanthus lutarioriparius]|uniref:Uncharacterized protein n=1 Tax=Miscanthus lutarioriparius TaxID=422564 RepID=A0A811QHG6_9POAL|nr:unnamed protein product [Miscanthus lutarioriparius]